MSSLKRAGALAGLLILSGPLSAAPYPGASAIEVDDFTGTVDIVVVGSKIDAVLTEGAERHAVDVDVRNGVLVIAGEKRPWRFNLGREIGGWGDSEKAFTRYLGAYPHLKITAPAGTDVVFNEAIARIKAGDLNSHVEIGGPWVEAEFGNVKSADVGIGGPGDTVLGDVAERADVAIGGSGDFRAGAVGSAEFAIGGSGDITVGAVKNDAHLDIGGSGGITTKDVGGDLRIAIGGSGDVRVARAQTGARLQSAGSGDIIIDEANGRLKASIAGSGDIKVARGHADDVDVSIAGSGDFDFGGVASNLSVSSVGSGSVSVARNEGSLSISGGRHADVTIGGRRVSERD